jgi:DNA-binding IclR family transcriptional regulator
LTLPAAHAERVWCFRLGKVLCAFGEAPPDLSEKTVKELPDIRRRGYAASFGERDPQVSSVAVPLWRAKGHLLGALCLSGPLSRLTQEQVPALAQLLLGAAARLALAMGCQECS